MVSHRRVKPGSLSDTILIVLGCTISLVGLFCVLSQLLTPWTLLGSVSYATAGPTLLLYNSQKFRHRAALLLPSHLRDMLFKKSLFENIMHESIYVKMAALLVACFVLPRTDADELAASLPGQFQALKHSSAMQLLTMDKYCNEEDTETDILKQSLPDQQSPIWMRWLRSAVHSLVPGCKDDKFLAKLVEISARKAVITTASAVNSLVADEIRSVVQKINSAVNCDWVNWCTSSGLIATSALYCAYSALHRAPHQRYVQYVCATARRQGCCLLRLLETGLRGASLDGAVVVGMGLLGGAAAAISAHSAVLRMQMEVDALPGSKGDVVKSRVGVSCSHDSLKRVAVSCVPATTLASVQLLEILLARRQCKPLCPLLHSIFDITVSNRITFTDVSHTENKKKKEVDPQLVYFCFALVAMFAQRLKCRPSQYSWLTCVYYAKFCPLLKSQTIKRE